jgi:hypothetical protein
MMKQTPSLIVMVLGILALHRLSPLLTQPPRSAAIQIDHRLFGMPADESGDDDGDDDGDSGDSE